MSLIVNKNSKAIVAEATVTIKHSKDQSFETRTEALDGRDCIKSNQRRKRKKEQRNGDGQDGVIEFKIIIKDGDVLEYAQ